MGKLKEFFRYEKIIITILVPVMLAGINYIKDLNTKIIALQTWKMQVEDKNFSEAFIAYSTRLNSIEDWKIKIEERDTPNKINDLDKRLISIEKDNGIMQRDLEIIKSRQDDKSKRNNIKFDEHEKLLLKNSENISFLKGYCLQTKNK